MFISTKAEDAGEEGVQKSTAAAPVPYENQYRSLIKRSLLSICKAKWFLQGNLLKDHGKGVSCGVWVFFCLFCFF